MTDNNLSEQIKANLAQGKQKEQIYQELLAQGLSINDIQEAFDSINTVDNKEESHKRTIGIIVTIGALLVGAGVFSFIAANWQEMPEVIKIGIILISMVVSYGSGWYLKEKSNLFKTGEALYLLGTIIYGAGIFLVAQIFNISIEWPDGFILWMIGTIAMAFAVESYSLFYLAIPLGVITLIGYPVDIFNSFVYNSFLVTPTFLLFVATVITCLTGWLVKNRISSDLKDFY